MRLAALIYAEPGRSGRCALTGICVLTALAIAVADRRLGVEISLVGLYVVPVGLAAWYGGFGAGYLTAAAAGIGLLAVDRLGGSFYSHSFYAYWDSVINGFTLAVVAALTATLRRQLRYEHRIARVDSLTRTLNPRAFKEAIADERLRLQRFGHTFSLIYFDLDDFKAVNDAHGHRSGDRTLRSFAGNIQRCLRRVDCLGRLGGDEFALLLPETGRERAMGVLRRLYKETGARSPTLGFSAGLVTFEHIATELYDPTEFVEHALEAADTAMYAAKRSGKGCAVSRVWHGKQVYEVNTWTTSESHFGTDGRVSPLEERLLRLD